MTDRSGLDHRVDDHRNRLATARRITGVSRDRGAVRVELETVILGRSPRERYGTTLEVAEELGPGAASELTLSLHERGTLRLRYARRGSVFADESAMVESLPEALDISLNGPHPGDDYIGSPDTKNVWSLDAGLFRVELVDDPFFFRIFDHAGGLLYQSLPGLLFQHPPTGSQSIDGTDLADGWPWFFRGLYPLGHIESPDGEILATALTARLFHDEHIYGLGEQYSDLDKRGRRIELFMTNAAGNTWNDSYKNIPFSLSSRGYGLFVHTSFPTVYHLGDRSHTRQSIIVGTDRLEMFVLSTASDGTRAPFGAALSRYTALTGAPGLPPLWSFGLWMSRMSYRSQDEVEATARELRERRIPCDVIHIDTDWFEKPWVNDLTFSPGRFPDHRGMIRRLRNDGFRLSLWQIPYIAEASRFFAEARDKGYFVRGRTGTQAMLEGFFGRAAVIDFSNPEAAAWYGRRIESLIEDGVTAIKTDFGEGAPVDGVYHGGGGDEMHNLYPLLYNRAVYSRLQSLNRDTLVWGRSAWAGSQRYPVVWGGDPAALWEDLANLWHGGLGLGLSGLPFWSVDIGGFGGTPTPRMYVRWAQAGLMVTHPRAHGPIGREPWVFGDEAEMIVRRWIEVRYRLIGYIWSEAHRAVRLSEPMHRAMVFDFSADPAAAVIDDQFLLGRSLLVAPILDEGTTRGLYLPDEGWAPLDGVDFHDTGSILPAGRHTVSAEIAEMPLYLRPDSMIPLVPPAQHTGERPWNEIDVLVNLKEQAAFTFRDRDGAALHLNASLRNGEVVVGCSADAPSEVKRIRWRIRDSDGVIWEPWSQELAGEPLPFNVNQTRTLPGAR